MKCDKSVTVKQLQGVAKTNGVKYSGLRKAELCKALGIDDGEGGAKKSKSPPKPKTGVDSMNLAELKKHAKNLNLKGYSAMRKSDLLNMIKSEKKAASPIRKPRKKDKGIMTMEEALNLLEKHKRFIPWSDITKMKRGDIMTFYYDVDHIYATVPGTLKEVLAPHLITYTHDRIENGEAYGSVQGGRYASQWMHIFEKDKYGGQIPVFLKPKWGEDAWMNDAGRGVTEDDVLIVMTFPFFRNVLIYDGSF